MDDRALERLDWGLVDYGQALEAMRRRHALRLAGAAADALICLEHPPVLTQGRHGQAGNVLWGADELARRGLALHQVERGGDVTYHGPGQAVVYLVLGLAGRGLGVRALVDLAQGAILETAGHFGVRAEVDPARPGAWVGGRKLASIGLAVRQGVSLHGLALNVNTRLEDFRAIRACGLEAQPTSLARELGRPLGMSGVFDRLYAALSKRLAV